MASVKQTGANRRNARRSTGPQAEEGVLACRGNALRHGLRALQTVIPGEDPCEWETRRAAVVEDLAPQGAVEAALAEQVAAKLWRLGRVVRHEADLIASAQDTDEIRLAHEKAHKRAGILWLERTDIPTSKDVQNARKAAETAHKKAADVATALRQLRGLPRMADDDALPDWTLFELLEKLCEVPEGLFGDEEHEIQLLAHHVRAILDADGTDEADAVADALCQQKAETAEAAREAGRRAKSLARRYRAALGRRRLAHGLLDPADLDKIQRYEAHLERGLHKALDRLRDLQAARGAAPPRGPSVAVVLVQTGGGPAPDGRLCPFGSIALEAHGAHEA